MTKIHFIVPYPELEEKVNRIFNNHPQSGHLQKTVSVITSERFSDLSSNALDCDVVIARGYAAEQLKQAGIQAPVVELPITGYDVIHCLYNCVQRFHPKKIALVGPFGRSCGHMDLSSIFGCEIRVFTPKNFEGIDEALESAIEHGCDMVLGIYSVHLRAIQYRIPSVVVELSDNAILDAIDTALRTVKLVAHEREKSELHKALIQSIKDGFLYVTPQRRISIANKTAEKIASPSSHPLVGRKVAEAFPFMKEDLSMALSGSDLPSQLYKLENGSAYLASFTPIQVSGETSGVMVTLQNVSTIQQNETQIRKKLGDKGLRARYQFPDIIHKSKAMDEVIHLAQKYAAVSSNVLIVGETGTGKELVAQSIHNASPRRDQPFVAVNCAALPENLLESELFGYVEGAFTGTMKGGKTGLFELANNGVLFLDEISEIPLGFQSKLLRVLQENEIRRVGDDRVISIDVRVIAATNRNLKEQVERGAFRRDLLFRLEILKLYIPPLRRRQEDIPLLFQHFIGQYNQQFGGCIRQISPEALSILEAFPFSGNIRELKNVAERLSVNCKGDSIIKEQQMREALYPRDVEVEPGKSFLLHSPESEQAHIQQALEECGYNQSQAAKLLGINRSTLWRKMQKYNLR